MLASIIKFVIGVHFDILVAKLVGIGIVYIYIYIYI